MPASASFRLLPIIFISIFPSTTTKKVALCVVSFLYTNIPIFLQGKLYKRFATQIYSFLTHNRKQRDYHSHSDKQPLEGEKKSYGFFFSQDSSEILFSCMLSSSSSVPTACFLCRLEQGSKPTKKTSHQALIKIKGFSRDLSLSSLLPCWCTLWKKIVVKCTAFYPVSTLSNQTSSSKAHKLVFTFSPLLLLLQKLIVIITSTGTTTREIITWAYILPGLHLLLLLERLDLTFSRERFMVRRETGEEKERTQKPDKTPIKNKERFWYLKFPYKKVHIHPWCVLCTSFHHCYSLGLFTPFSLFIPNIHTHTIYLYLCVCCVIIISPLDMK